MEENNRFFIGHWAQQCVYGVFSCTVVTEAYTCASLACNCWEYTKNVKDIIVKQETFDRIVMNSLKTPQLMKYIKLRSPKLRS